MLGLSCAKLRLSFDLGKAKLKMNGLNPMSLLNMVKIGCKLINFTGRQAAAAAYALAAGAYALAAGAYALAATANA
jgi:hypothetical protein